MFTSYVFPKCWEKKLRLTSGVQLWRGSTAVHLQQQPLPYTDLEHRNNTVTISTAELVSNIMCTEFWHWKLHSWYFLHPTNSPQNTYSIYFQYLHVGEEELHCTVTSFIFTMLHGTMETVAHSDDIVETSCQNHTPAQEKIKYSKKSHILLQKFGYSPNERC